MLFTDFTVIRESWRVIVKCELSMRVPLILRLPGAEHAGHVVDDLVRGMHQLDGGLIDGSRLKAQIEARDAQLGNKVSKDAQITAIRGARAYLGDKLIRVAKPHRILDPAAGPLIGVKLNILTRKSLGGLQTDLESRALSASGQPIPGLYAIGEVAGFGGGGYHGYNALEGTFLGGCIFSGRQAGRSA